MKKQVEKLTQDDIVTEIPDGVELIGSKKMPKAVARLYDNLTTLSERAKDENAEPDGYFLWFTDGSYAAVKPKTRIEVQA